ncbi:hypothetical protein BGLT_07437 [Caballeronia glathei]|nr:hypothetical protein BGLT_07437 [Caballeronia glathei]
MGRRAPPENAAPSGKNLDSGAMLPERSAPANPSNYLM